MNQHRENTPLARLVIAFMLAAFAAVFAASLIGMTGAMDRTGTLSATDCEMTAEVCEELP